MSSAVVENEETKLRLIEFLEQNNIEYNLCECCGCKRFCIDLNSDCKSEIIVQASNKDIRKIHPHEILYIAIENRKSVLYLTHGKVETNQHLEYWKGILDPETFTQPHHSFIVNLNYVDEVTKEFVKVKHDDKEYSVYTSSRKIGSFKKAFLKFKER